MKSKNHKTNSTGISRREFGGITALGIAWVCLLFSCGPIHHVSDAIEEPHYALYRQKVLMIHSIQKNQVLFINPEKTRYYYLKGRRYRELWAPGDTFVIDSNLVSFYRLRFVNKPVE